ncbi:putative invasin, partial [Vibrio ichthyoenteri ATCC 700023]
LVAFSSATKGATVSAANEGKTDVNGIATAVITSTSAGSNQVTAMVGDKSADVSVPFLADATHPTIKLKGDDKSGVSADNKGLHDLTATVLDVNGNVIEGIKVTFSSATKGATVSAVNEGKTDVNGIATAVITSTSAGSNKVTATVGDKSADVSVLFV